VTDVDLSVRYAFQFAALEHGEECLVWLSHEESRRGAVREDNDGVASAIREFWRLRFLPSRGMTYVSHEGVSFFGVRVI
jgi:hypothetical protein